MFHKVGFAENMLRGWAAMFATGILGGQTWTPPARGTDQVAIAQIVALAASVNEVRIAHLRVARASEPMVAFVEANFPTSDGQPPESGWMLLAKDEGRWRLLWGQTTLGAESCGVLAINIRYARQLAGAYNADRSFFTDQFDALAKKIEAMPADELCDYVSVDANSDL